MRRAATEKGGTVGKTTASKQNNCFGAVVNTGNSWSQNMGVGMHTLLKCPAKILVPVFSYVNREH